MYPHKPGEYDPREDPKWGGWSRVKPSQSVEPYHEWYNDGELWRIRYKEQYLQIAMEAREKL